MNHNLTASVFMRYFNGWDFMELFFTILIEAYGSPAELIERPVRPNADCLHLVTLQV
jgi:hypothetical protein